jgi:hypothetical protein
MHRVTAEHHDEGEDEQPDDEEHFAERRPELRLAVPLDSEEIDEAAAGFVINTVGPRWGRTSSTHA